jgi:hypothetical protein
MMQGGVPETKLFQFGYGDFMPVKFRGRVLDKRACAWILVIILAPGSLHDYPCMKLIDKLDDIFFFLLNF